MNKIKVLRGFRGLITVIAIFTIINISDKYNEIIDFYIQKKENYANLEQLNKGILDYYQIDLETNEELNELSRKVKHNENMIAGFEPNTKKAKNYWWYLVGVILIIIILYKWLDYTYDPSENETTTG